MCRLPGGEGGGARTNNRRPYQLRCRPLRNAEHIEVDHEFPTDERHSREIADRGLEARMRVRIMARTIFVRVALVRPVSVIELEHALSLGRPHL